MCDKCTKKLHQLQCECNNTVTVRDELCLILTFSITCWCDEIDGKGNLDCRVLVLWLVVSHNGSGNGRMIYVWNLCC